MFGVENPLTETIANRSGTAWYKSVVRSLGNQRDWIGAEKLYQASSGRPTWQDCFVSKYLLVFNKYLKTKNLFCFLIVSNICSVRAPALLCRRCLLPSIWTRGAASAETWANVSSASLQQFANRPPLSVCFVHFVYCCGFEISFLPTLFRQIQNVSVLLKIFIFHVVY